ncbi:TonB family protein [Carboxylicivirga taeanensis]|uniref:TonB family protein n=1 Tax=Carboxylicivirga taeanensis TaxID=1416875 RepID=UPI003F6DB11D
MDTLKMRFTFLLIVCSLFEMAHSQNTIVTYYDTHWKEVGKEQAAYYREAFRGKGRRCHVRDYFINGQLQMSGTYRSSLQEKRQGYFEYFYPSGGRRSHGEYKNDKMKGEWKWYREDGSVSSIEHYKRGKLKAFTFWDENGKQLEGEQNIYELAQFVGGPEALANFIATTVVYPPEAQQNGVSGRVFVSFIVNENGFVENVAIERSAHSDLNNEAMRVVKLLPRWIPGRHHNLPSDISFTVPINFVLE